MFHPLNVAAVIDFKSDWPDSDVYGNMCDRRLASTQMDVYPLPPLKRRSREQLKTWPKAGHCRSPSCTTGQALQLRCITGASKIPSVRTSGSALWEARTHWVKFHRVTNEKMDSWRSFELTFAD